MHRFSLQILKGLFGILEHVAPSVAGSAAFHLFCRTPHRGRVTQKEKLALASSRDFMKQARKHLLASEKGRVVAYEFNNWGARRDGPAVLVIHGWRSRSEHMRVIVAALLERGFRVVSLDLPGHGASGGRVLDLPKAVAAIHATAHWLGPFDAMIGHSFGGTVALNAIAGSVAGVPPVPVRRLVMIASPNALPDLFARFGSFIGLGRAAQKHMERRVEAISGQPLENFVGGEQLRELHIPTLVVHAPDDREVSERDARALGNAGQHVSITWAPGLGHRRILADPGIAAHVAAFVASRRQRGLSGLADRSVEKHLPIAN